MNEYTDYTDSNSSVLNFVHMIGDRITLLDPVEELCFFASKETLARCASPVPVITVVEEMGSLGRWGFYMASGIMGSPLLPPLGCARSRLNGITSSCRRLHKSSELSGTLIAIQRGNSTGELLFARVQSSLNLASEVRAPRSCSKTGKIPDPLCPQ
ncbi:hypothetical protein ILYODFUR_036652 [Ilyodon furcidens]|uniref:Uncharacterized protein n=1 Tax=Ilyodon furcidens TaxID=33524 RepID=A0ABV0V9Q6_9TELE